MLIMKVFDHFNYSNSVLTLSSMSMKVARTFSVHPILC